MTNDESLNGSNFSSAPQPMQNIQNSGSLLSFLLKSPLSVAQVIAEGKDCLKSGLSLLIWTILLYAVFGLAAGLFSGWSVGFMAAIKSPLIVITSLFLCLPSLYVFGCIGGTVLSIRQAFMLGSASVAMMGLLLVGLAPVVWLFSVSTESLSFMVMLILLIWLIAVGFALRFVRKLRSVMTFQRAGGIRIWFLVFVVVLFQMTTVMRPVLTRPELGHVWFTGEKKFFLVHFANVFDNKK